MTMEINQSFCTTVKHSIDIQNYEEVACNLCGSETYELIEREHLFAIRSCVNCGLVYASPQPTKDELPNIYEQMYLTDSEEEVRKRSLGYIEPHIRSIVSRQKPNGGRLLDIGCGYGQFLKCMSDLPWELHGMDYASKSVEYVQKILPSARIVQGGIEDADFPKNHFDCITLIAVLEHLKDPKGALRRVMDWLAPDGLLLVQVPYVAPYLRLKRFFPSLPIYFEAPRHLFDFSPKVLKRYFVEIGITDIHAEIGRPYSSPSRLRTALTWGIKITGLFIYHLSLCGYIYPFAASEVVYGRKPKI